MAHIESLLKLLPRGPELFFSGVFEKDWRILMIGYDGYAGCGIFRNSFESNIYDYPIKEYLYTLGNYAMRLHCYIL